jgi:hypothetical protein
MARHWTVEYKGVEYNVQESRGETRIFKSTNGSDPEPYLPIELPMLGDRNAPIAVVRALKIAYEFGIEEGKRIRSAEIMALLKDK